MSRLDRAYLLLHDPVRGILLLRWKDRWQLPGGHLEWGEGALEGALRETFEETGFTIDPAKVHLVGRRKSRVLFTAPLDPGQWIDLRLSREHHGFEWVDWAELPRVHWLTDKLIGRAMARLDSPD